MVARSESPQIGLIDIDPSALETDGVYLTELVSELAARLDDASAIDAPLTGWRVLTRDEPGRRLLGAPVDADCETWRLAYVQDRGHGLLVTVHPDPAPLRPSRSQRGTGLQLRWPAVMTENRGDEDFAIDIVNSGDTRWRPDGDGFLVVGTFTAPGVADFAIGWASSGQSRAVALDPGEYARVPVSIQPTAWASLKPGAHELHVDLVDLGLVPNEPLSITLSESTITEQRARAMPPRSKSNDRHRALDAHIAQLRAQVVGATHLDAVVKELMSATSDDDATARISETLCIDKETVRSLIQLPLQELRPGNVERLEHRIAELTLRRGDS